MKRSPDLSIDATFDTVPGFQSTPRIWTLCSSSKASSSYPVSRLKINIVPEWPPTTQYLLFGEMANLLIAVGMIKSECSSVCKILLVRSSMTFRVLSVDAVTSFYESGENLQHVIYCFCTPLMHWISFISESDHSFASPVLCAVAKVASFLLISKAQHGEMKVLLLSCFVLPTSQILIVRS